MGMVFGRDDTLVSKCALYENQNLLFGSFERTGENSVFECVLVKTFLIGLLLLKYVSKN